MVLRCATKDESVTILIWVKSELEETVEEVICTLPLSFQRSSLLATPVSQLLQVLAIQERSQV